MKISLLRLKTVLFLFVLSLNGIFAQDTWTPSNKGINLNWDHHVNLLHPFKGNLYAAVGSDTGVLYSSATGNLGSWTSGFGQGFYSFNAINSTNEGAGYMYASAYGFSMSPTVFITTDGSAYNPFYYGSSTINHIVPFKGLGTVDSIYLIEDLAFGSIISRAPYNANDPLDTLSTFDTVLNFDGLSTFTQIRCTALHNGALYFGTNNGATIWKSTDGTTWLQNIWVGNGFGNPNNAEITAMQSFGGYVYAGTFNYSDGAQIWRSSNDTAWTMVAQYPSYERITDFEVAGGKLYASMEGNSSVRGSIVKTLDGFTFLTSDSLGFGIAGNTGHLGCFATFGNNLYYGSENYYTGGALAPAGGTEVRGGGSSTGGQIWRHCLGVQPSLNLGNDSTICSSANILLNAGSATAFYWNDSSTTQTMLATGNVNGSLYYCYATASNGCDAVDSVVVSSVPNPTMTITSPLVAGGITICQGDSVQVAGSVNSNIRIAQAPIHKTSNVPIAYSLGNTYDTINVTGLTECSCTALYSVTIDSLYHQYNSDVAIGLYSPSGFFINLVNNIGGTNYFGTEFNMTAAATPGASASSPYTGQFAPQDPFTSLTGSASGNWIIQTNDNYSLDDGVLKGWTLRFSVADTIISYSWSSTAGLSSTTTLATTITPPASNLYTVTATNSVGCTDDFDINITVPTIAMTVADDSICYGSATSLSGNGPNNYWSPVPAVSAAIGTVVTTTAMASTMYYLMDTINGCVVTDSAMLFVDPSFAITSSAPTICFGDTALAYSVGSGGTMPCVWYWSDGSNNYSNDSIVVTPAATTSYTITATDAIGCTAGDITSIGVTPSTDIYGSVVTPGAIVVEMSNVVLYRYEGTLMHFDTVQVVTTDASGQYHFSSVNHGDYLIEVFPLVASYPTLVPTYYGDHFLWDSASVIMHGCGMNDTLNIIAVEETSFGTGPGFLHGRIVEGDGFERIPGEPIPGIDVKLGRNPGGQMVTNTQTDSNGEYSYSNVSYGAYTVYVDIPGMGRDSSYTFTVDSANTYFPYLNYIVDSTTIYIVPDAGIGVNDLAANQMTFNVYPNPSKGNVTIEYNLLEDASVSLGIYNVLGIKITDVSSGDQAAGKYKYNLTEQNKQLSSGVYFVTLIVNGKVNIHKIIITE